ncbi:hypothetical protein NLJ89_g3057 [Agrocybe chaxingu]|uniref:Uncharacterized protein n=1 Tax=Agrocybe chaxingu TaxID=84603 RepID=A0A9W8K626_9AGAR|nr:hypothetical protein NLJ89_g3057 [Agrocybe chaxingu]
MSTPGNTLSITKIKLSLVAPPLIATIPVEEDNSSNDDKFQHSGRRILSIDLAENIGPVYSSNHPDPILPPRPKPSTEDQYSQLYKLGYDPTPYGNPDKGTGIYATMLLPPDLPQNREANQKGDELRNEKIVRDIRKVVQDDMKLLPGERIDTVVLDPEPWTKHLAALDGLSPKHLKVRAGFEESIDLYALTVLSNPWTELESLLLDSECMGWKMHTSSNGPDADYAGFEANYPNIIKQIKTLTLYYCCGFKFQADNLPEKLLHLKIIENDAMAMFVCACTNIPGFMERVETVYIASTVGCDTSDPEPFKQHLVKCTNVCDLTLVMGGRQNTDLGLAKFIPPSVEKLAFHCSTSDSMLENLDEWLECAADPAWLPVLNSFTLKMDGEEVTLLSKNKRKELDPSKAFGFEQKIKAIMKALGTKGVMIEDIRQSSN